MNKLFRFILLFIVSISLHFPASCQQTMVTHTLQDSVINTFFHELYAMHYGSGEKILQDYRDQDFPYFFMKINYHWWQNIAQDHTADHLFLLAESLEAASNFLKENEESISKDDLMLSHLLIQAFYVRMSLLESNYFDALMGIRKIPGTVKKSIGLAPVNPFHQLTAGLYLYGADWIKENYPLLTPFLIFIPEGNKDLGIDYLRSLTLSEYHLLRTESTYFLMKIYSEGEEDFPSAIHYAYQLMAMYPENLIYRSYLIHLLQQSGSLQEAKSEKKKYFELLETNTILTNDQKVHFRNIIKD